MRTFGNALLNERVETLCLHVFRLTLQQECYCETTGYIPLNRLASSKLDSL